MTDVQTNIKLNGEVVPIERAGDQIRVIDEDLQQTYNFEETLILLNLTSTKIIAYEKMAKEILNIVKPDGMARNQSGAKVALRIREAMVRAMDENYAEQAFIFNNTKHLINNGTAIAALFTSLGDLVNLAKKDFNEAHEVDRIRVNGEIKDMNDKYGHAVVGDAVSGELEPITPENVVSTRARIEEQAAAQRARLQAARLQDSISAAIKKPDGK